MPSAADIFKALEVDVTAVYGGGRTQIPAEIRNQLDIRDGDKVVWYVKRGEYFLRKAGTPPMVAKPHFTEEPTREELESILRKRKVSEQEIKRLLEGYQR